MYRKQHFVSEINFLNYMMKTINTTIVQATVIKVVQAKSKIGLNNWKHVRLLWLPTYHFLLHQDT